MEHRYSLIVLVPNLSHQFFHYVLDRNDAGNVSVAVYDRSHLQFIMLKIFQQQGNFCRTVDVGDIL